MDTSIEHLERFAAEHLTDAQVEHLVGWIANRQDRQASLAGATRDARWRRTLEWCSIEQRLALLVWLQRRRRAGESYSPM